MIAEKLLALEFEKSNLSFSSAQKNLIIGRKEQSMRQMMVKKNGFDKVKLDSAVIKTIAKQIKKTYNISFLTVDAQQKQKIVSENLESLIAIKHKIENSLFINYKQITLNDKMPMSVKEILFFTEPRKNFLYGPIPINKMNFMFFEIEGWNTIVSITSEQKRQSFADAQKTYNELNALKIYEQYVSNLMRGKKINFDSNIFPLFSNKVSEIYLIEKDRKESAIQNSIWDEEIKK